jgi:menaquinone-dependent protoporphyrinogen oxidase
MKVLVTAASKHGATTGIAEAITETLNQQGLDATLTPIGDVRSIAEYPAVVIGSGVYAGRWLKPAREFLQHHERELKERKVWLFSSGPVGDPPKPAEESPEFAQMKETAGAIEHKIFSGKVDPATLSLPERAIVAALHAPTGDFRDFDAIRSWAAGVAGALRSTPAADN